MEKNQQKFKKVLAWLEIQNQVKKILNNQKQEYCRDYLCSNDRKSKKFVDHIKKHVANQNVVK